jgi:hypothetical protein
MNEQQIEDALLSEELAVREKQQAPFREALAVPDPEMSLIAAKAAMFDELVDMVAHADFCATVEIEAGKNNAWREPRARFRHVLERACKLQDPKP